jgi:hypothetical protein
MKKYVNDTLNITVLKDMAEELVALAENFFTPPKSGK